MRIDLRGYARDYTIDGLIETGGLRLSDTLEDADEVVIHNATLHSLASEQAIYARQTVIGRDELLVVQALTPPPTNDQRRVRTVRHALRVQLGPYTCFGEVHALPGVAPLRTLLVRRTMVPLTNCLIKFQRGGRDEYQRAPLLIINGRQISDIQLATSQQLENELAGRPTTGAFEQPSPLT